METTQWNVVSSITVQCVSSFIQLIILSVYIISFIRSFKSTEDIDVSIKMEVLNITTLLVLFVQSVMWSLNYSGLLTGYFHMDCDYVFFFCYLLYFYYNGLLYSVYAVRLHLVYDHTKFELSKRTKMIIWIALIVFVLWMNYVCYSEIFIRNIVEPVHWKSITLCWGYGSSIGVVFFIFLLTSTVFSLITMILFVKPLFVLYSKTMNMASNQINLLKLASKYSLLTLITIVSTACAGIGHVFIHWPFIAGICVLIQSFCIMLYEKRFSNIYDCICWKLNKALEKQSWRNRALTASMSNMHSRNPNHTKEDLDTTLTVNNNDIITPVSFQSVADQVLTIKAFAAQSEQNPLPRPNLESQVYSKSNLF